MKISYTSGRFRSEGGPMYDAGGEMFGWQYSVLLEALAERGHLIKQFEHFQILSDGTFNGSFFDRREMIRRYKGKFIGTVMVAFEVEGRNGLEDDL